MGAVYGTIDTKIVHLNSIVLDNQTIFLIDKLNFPVFEESDLDGVLGISRLFSPLHHKSPFVSVLENSLNYIKENKVNGKVVLILKLGGNYPYMKIYFIEDYDYYHIKLDEFGKKEKIVWINLFEKGKLMLALKSVKLKYYQNNAIIKEELVVKDCLETGCRALLDTKSYFIYGPADQISLLKKIQTPNCNDYDNLPDIEFSFFDVNSNTSLSKSTMDLTLFPEDYLVHEDEEDNNICVAGIKDHKTDYGWNFGIILLKKFMIFYDFKNDLIGFSRVEDANTNEVEDL